MIKYLKLDNKKVHNRQRKNDLYIYIYTLISTVKNKLKEPVFEAGCLVELPQ